MMGIRRWVAVVLGGMILSGGPGCGLPLADGAPGLNPPEAPTGLLMDLMAEPLGLENPAPRMGWIVNDPDPDEIQTAYQILVADTRAALAQGQGTVWDSGKVASSESSNVSYAGPALEPDRVYYWQVRTWDKDDQPGPYSPPQRFATAVKDAWVATGIWSGGTAEEAWTDYTLEVDFEILETAVAVWFRRSDAGNAYLWQVQWRDGQARLRPHVFVNGAHTVLKEVPVAVEPGKQYRLRIELSGAEFKTYIDGELVDTTRHEAHAAGSVGLRQGGAESGRYARLRVFHADGVLLQDDFDGAEPVLAGGRLEDGKLVLDRGQQALDRSQAADTDFVFLRKAFELEDRAIRHAVVHVTALCNEPAAQYVYKLHINDTFVGAGPERGFKGVTRYNTFDVSQLLRPGEENVLAALNYSTDQGRRRFLLQMRVQYEDGTSQVIATDRSWKALGADHIYRNLGNLATWAFFAPREGLDARSYPFGWKELGFDDSGWLPARERGGVDYLHASATGNTEMHLVAPERVVDKGDQRFFIDFGQAVVGGLQLTLNGVAGHEIDVRLGEELSAPETVRHAMRTGNVYQEVWTLTDGPQQLEHFGYRVFRYAEILNAPAGFGPDQIRAVALRLGFDDDAAVFSSSDPVLNDVWEFCKYSIKATSLDVYVDTHTRERLNYEGDALVNQASHYAVDREYAFPRYSVEYLYYRPTWPTEYKLQTILMAWEDYLYTGNPDSLREHYPALKNKTLEEFVNQDGLVEKAPDAGGQNGRYGRDLVDWPDSQRDGYRFTNINTVINAFNYQAIEYLGRIAAVLGEDEDARRYGQLAERLRSAMNEHLYDPASGRFRDGKGVDHFALHANAFPVALGVVDPEKVPAVADYMVSRGMAVSVYGSHFLLEGLYAANRGQAALNLMNAKDGNSWGHMMYNLGATIVCEAWDPPQKPNMSFSHAWASAPANAIPRGLFGVRPLEPGFNRFQIKPQPADLEWARITVPSIKGTIGVAFEQADERFDLVVDIPANTRADVYVPVAGLADVMVEQNGQPVQGRLEDGYLVFEGIGSGRHSFHRIGSPATGQRGLRAH